MFELTSVRTSAFQLSTFNMSRNDNPNGNDNPIVKCYNNPDNSYCGEQELLPGGERSPHCWNCGISLFKHPPCGHKYCEEKCCEEKCCPGEKVKQ